MKYTAIQYFENKKKGVIVAKTTVTELVDGAPKTVKEGASKEEAEELKAKFTEVGAVVELA